MKICLVSYKPPPYGGISNWTLLLCRYINTKENIILRIVDIAPKLRNVTNEKISMRIIVGGLQLIKDYIIFVKELLFFNPDIVHITTPGQLALIRDNVFLWTAKIFKVKSVYHIRFGRIMEICNQNTIEWRLMMLAIKKTDVVIALDDSTETTIRLNFPKKKVKKLANGIDFREIKISENEKKKKNILYLGWIIKEKGIEELCAAVEKYDLHEWLCYIVGPGDENFIEKLKTKYVSENIVFKNEIQHNEALMVMAECDIFVLPSYTEAFPNVIVEAMALGRPIIATNVGAVPEMLSDGCGIVVPPKDIDALGSALKDLSINEYKRQELGIKAKVKAEKEYSIETVIDQLIYIWNNTYNKQ
jgi:glycosyltransferase involved in cell wall biosynthesis